VLFCGPDASTIGSVIVPDAGPLCTIGVATNVPGSLVQYDHYLRRYTIDTTSGNASTIVRFPFNSLFATGGTRAFMLATWAQCVAEPGDYSHLVGRWQDYHIWARHKGSEYVVSCGRWISDTVYRTYSDVVMASNIRYHICSAATHGQQYPDIYIDGHYVTIGTIAFSHPYAETYGPSCANYTVGPDASYRFPGHVADYMIWIDTAPVWAIPWLADPDNIDLRVPNGPPLILPVRTYWPSVVAAPPRYLKRRSLGLRAGSREAVI